MVDVPFGDEYFEDYNRYHAPSMEEVKRKAETMSEILNASNVYEVRSALTVCDKYELKDIIEMLWSQING